MSSNSRKRRRAEKRHAQSTSAASTSSPVTEAPSAALAPTPTLDLINRAFLEPRTTGAPDEGEMDPHRIARHILQTSADERGRLTSHYFRSAAWRYDGRRFVEVPDSDQHAYITRQIKSYLDTARVTNKEGLVRPISATLINAVNAAWRALCHLDGASVPTMPSWIGRAEVRGAFIEFANSLLPIDQLDQPLAALRLREHTPEWFSQIKRDYPFDASATCPLWLSVLDRALDSDGERIGLLQEFMGLTLTHDTSFQRFLMMVGAAGSGKSTILKIWEALLGPEHVSNVALEHFDRPHVFAQTLGRLLNICADANEVEKVAEGTLKATVSGDPQTFDRKYLPIVDARATARIVLTANELPPFQDRSEGVWRRMLVLPFNTAVPEDAQDEKLETRLLTELSGILNWALDGLRRLKARGKFIEPGVSKAAREEFQAQRHPTRTWLADTFVATKFGFEKSSEVYAAYTAWCEANGHRPASATIFASEVVRVFPTAQKSVKRKDEHNKEHRGFAGIALASKVGANPSWLTSESQTTEAA